MDSARCECSVQASLNFSTTSRFLPASHLEVGRPVTRSNFQNSEQSSRASRRSSSDLQLIPLEEDSQDNFDSPITHHRRRRRRIDQSSSANPASTLSHAIAARPKKSTTRSASSESPSAGFFPRLSRILESTDEEAVHRYPRSFKNSNKEQRSHSRRSDVADVARQRTAWYKSYKLQQQHSSLSNPSLTSLFSSLTHSSGSSGSSTVTQRSYDRSTDLRRRRGLKHRSKTREKLPSEHRVSSKALKERRSDSMDLMEKPVGRIEEEAVLKETSKPPSKASSRASSLPSSRSSLSDSGNQDEQSLINGKSKPPSGPRSEASSSASNSDVDEPPSKMASITAKRKPLLPSLNSNMNKDVWKRQDTFSSDSGISVSSSPEVNTRSEQTQSVQHLETDVEDDSDSHAESSSSDNDNDDDDDDENEPTTRPGPTARSSSTTITGTNSQPRALMDNDPLVQRVQEQEEEMRTHMDLHSPRPQRRVRPPVTSPCEPSPALPLFDHRTTAVPPHLAYPPHAPDLPHGNGGFLHPHYPHPLQPVPPFHPDLQKKTIAGYELLAEKLAEQSQETGLRGEVWHPVYRKFAQLNHRILLHLQDEISQLEEELRIIDESIAQMAEMMEGDIPPASRRMETRFGSEMHHRRTEILGRVFQKLVQYNQALASFASASRNYSPAHTSDLSPYRAWMAEHEPVDEAESRFLEHDQDLMALKNQPPTPPVQSTLATPRVVANHQQDRNLLLAALLIPPIAVCLVTGIVAKLVILSILAFAAFIVLESKGSGPAAQELDKAVGETTETEKKGYVEKSIVRSRPGSDALEPSTPIQSQIRRKQGDRLK